MGAPITNQYYGGNPLDRGGYGTKKGKKGKGGYGSPKGKGKGKGGGGPRSPGYNPEKVRPPPWLRFGALVCAARGLRVCFGVCFWCVLWRVLAAWAVCWRCCDGLHSASLPAPAPATAGLT